MVLRTLTLSLGVFVAITLTGCGHETAPTPTPAARPNPIANPTLAATSKDPIAAVTSVVFDGSRSTSSASGGITNYQWSFGDGTQSSGVVVQHTFSTPGTKTITLTATDANGTSAPGSVTVTIKDMGGNWRTQFNIQTRTYSLIQNGTVLTGTYTNTSLSGQTWTVNGSIDSSRRLTITATYPGETTVVLSNAIVDATASSLTGVTHGGSADNQTLTYQRVQ